MTLYEKTFDQVRLPEERAQSLRDELIACCSQTEKEENPMKDIHSLRRPTAFLIAAALTAAMTVSALACGGYYVNYELHNDGGAADGGVELADGEIDAALDGTEEYDWHEVDGQIIATLPGAADDVDYELADGECPLEGVELAAGETDFRSGDYRWHEADGQIVAELPGENN